MALPQHTFLGVSSNQFIDHVRYLNPGNDHEPLNVLDLSWVYTPRPNWPIQATPRLLSFMHEHRAYCIDSEEFTKGRALVQRLTKGTALYDAGLKNRNSEIKVKKVIEGRALEEVGLLLNSLTSRGFLEWDSKHLLQRTKAFDEAWSKRREYWNTRPGLTYNEYNVHAEDDTRSIYSTPTIADNDMAWKPTGSSQSDGTDRSVASKLGSQFEESTTETGSLSISDISNPETITVDCSVNKNEGPLQLDSRSKINAAAQLADKYQFPKNGTQPRAMSVAILSNAVLNQPRKKKQKLQVTSPTKIAVIIQSSGLKEIRKKASRSQEPRPVLYSTQISPTIPNAETMESNTSTGNQTRHPNPSQNLCSPPDSPGMANAALRREEVSAASCDTHLSRFVVRSLSGLASPHTFTRENSPVEDIPFRAFLKPSYLPQTPTGSTKSKNRSRAEADLNSAAVTPLVNKGGTVSQAPQNPQANPQTPVKSLTQTRNSHLSRGPDSPLGKNFEIYLTFQKQNEQFDLDDKVPVSLLKESSLPEFFALYSQRSEIPLDALPCLKLLMVWGKQAHQVVVRRDATADDWTNLKDKIKSLYRVVRKLWHNETDFGIWVPVGDQTSGVEFDGSYAGGL